MPVFTEVVGNVSRDELKDTCRAEKKEIALVVRKIKIPRKQVNSAKAIPTMKMGRATIPLFIRGSTAKRMSTLAANGRMAASHGPGSRADAAGGAGAGPVMKW